MGQKFQPLNEGENESRCVRSILGLPWEDRRFVCVRACVRACVYSHVSTVKFQKGGKGVRKQDGAIVKTCTNPNHVTENEEHKLKNKADSQAVMAHTFNPSTSETKAGGSL